MSETRLAAFVRKLYEKYEECRLNLDMETKDTDKYNEQLANHYFEIACLYMQFYEAHKSNFTRITKNIEKCKEYLCKLPLYDGKFELLFDKHNKIDDELQTELQEITNEVEKYEFEIVVLGITKKSHPIKLSSDFKKIVTDIKLIENINLAEDQILFADKNYLENLFEQYKYLSALYSNAGQIDISNNYKEKIVFAELLDTSSDNDDTEIIDIEAIDQIIKMNIKTDHSSFTEILETIKTYSKLDRIYDTDKFRIERKYIKYCLEFWYEEIEQILNSCMESNLELFIELFSILKQQTINDILQNISKNFKNLKYNKLLAENPKLILAEDEKNLRFHLQLIFYDLLAQCRLAPRLKLIVNTYLENVAINSNIELETKYQYVEIKGEIIIVNLVLPKIIDMVKSNVSIKEIRFIACNTVHINADLEKSVFHGKNIVVCAHKLIIHGEHISWNVSGRDSLDKFKTDAGQVNGYGKRGEDGEPGESGGNVWIYALEYIHTERFNVISNGGNGSVGQNGGKGRDGVNGHSITVRRFLSLFPGAAQLTSTKNYEKNLSSIRSLCSNIDTKKNEKKSPIGISSNFVQIKIQRKHEIIFSYSKNFSKAKTQSFLLYKGSSGQKGLSGGEGGSGGQGGFEGDITINNELVKITNNPGKDGFNGSDGPNGKHGIDGYDMGYIDCSPYFPEKNRPKYYGQCGSVKLFIDYSPNDGKRKIWCNYKQKYAEIHYEVKTASTITDHKIESKSQRYEKRINPSRKQPSIIENTKETYRNYVNNTKFNIMPNKSQYEEMHENISTRVSIQRNITFETSEGLTDMYQDLGETIPITSEYEQIKNISEIITKITSNFNDTSNLLKTTPLELNHLNEIYQSFYECKNNIQSSSEKISEIDKILINKYLFTTFREINKNITIPAGSFSSEIEKTKLDTYIQRGNEVFKFYEKNSENINLITTITLLYGQHCYEKQKNSKMGKAFEEFKEFIREKNILFDQFRNFLYQNDIDLYFKWSKNDISITDFEKLLENKPEISDRYLQFKNEVNTKFNWNKFISGTDSITAEVELYMYHNVWLTYSNVSAFSYILNISHTLHNRRATTYVDLNSIFTLIENRKLKNSIFGVIISKLITFTEKTDIDQYLKQTNNNSINYNEKSYFSINKRYENIEDIVQYFPSNEQNLLRNRLNKIKSQNIGNQFILFALRKRFLYEGRYVSTAEVLSLIDDVLASSLKNNNELNLIAWILLAFPQKEWTGELLILTIENHFQRLVEETEYRKWFSKINNDVLLIFKIKLEECHEKFIIVDEIRIRIKLLYLYNITTDIYNPKDLFFHDWDDALELSFWDTMLTNLIGSNNKTFVYQKILSKLLKLNDEYGRTRVINFLNSIDRKMLESGLDNFLNVLSCLERNGFKLSENNEFIPIASNDENEMNLIEFMKSNVITSHLLRSKLPKIEEYMKRIQTSPIMNYEKDEIEKWIKDNSNNFTKFFADDYIHINLNDEDCQILAIISRAVELEKGFRLSKTQILAILCFCVAKNPNSEYFRKFAQIMTGEGKTLIIVALAIINALRKRIVHIVTSSNVLAKRDALNNKNLYNLFGISVSHNSIENNAERIKIYKENVIIYGIFETFIQDSILEFDCYSSDIENRVLIIDEIDSILLDQPRNMLCISHNVEGLDRLDSVFIFIWQWINRPATNLKDLESNFDVKAIKYAILNDIYGIIKVDDIGRFSPDIDRKAMNDIWEILILSKIIDDNGKLLTEDFNHNEKLVILLKNNGFYKYKSCIRYTINECINRNKFIHVPNYLKSFIDENFEIWVNSAINALRLKEGEEYVVDIDRSAISSDRNPRIMILDKNTGTDIINGQWSNGLHQFLQLKHGCKLSLQSLKTFFKANVYLLIEYRMVFGLTGTLGNTTEICFLYGLRADSVFRIPSENKSKFLEYDPIVCYDENSWIDNIYVEVYKLVQKKRSVLIVCETIVVVEKIYNKFKHCTDLDSTKLFKYTRDFQQLLFLDYNQVLDDGCIIVATNLAGRGTDINISDTLEKSGGLHVCLTYMPKNIRIEQQAFGRAARKGQNGSGQQIIFFHNENYLKTNKFDANSIIYGLRNYRNYMESHRLSLTEKDMTIVDDVNNNIGEDFTKIYRKTEIILTQRKIDGKYKLILLQALKDRWAYKVHRYSETLKNLNNQKGFQNMKNYLRYLEKFNSEDDFSKWVNNNPVQEIKLGINYLFSEKDDELKKAGELFDKVIKSEPNFCEAAHYYKALNLIKEKKQNNSITNDMIKNEFLNSGKLFRRKSWQATHKAKIMKEIAIINSDRLNPINGFYDQQNSISNIYNKYLESIDYTLGHKISAQTLAKEIKVELETAELIIKNLIELNLLTKSKIVQKNITITDIINISNKYGISSQTLHSLIKNFADGTEIDEIFFKKLKKTIPLPSREDFWNQLVKKIILEKEIKYGIMDISKLKNINMEFVNRIKRKIFKEEDITNDDEAHKFGEYLNKSKEAFVKQSDNEIFLYPVEQITNNNKETENQILIKTSDWFIKCCGEDQYVDAENLGAVTLNIKGNLNEINLNEIYLDEFDSISYAVIMLKDHHELVKNGDDFKGDINCLINKEEAENIFKELIDLKVIEMKENLYRLIISYSDIDKIKLRKYSLYENHVKNAIKTCFSFRNALENLRDQQKYNTSSISIILGCNPHHQLLLNLIENRVFEPIKLTNRKDIYSYEKFLAKYYKNPENHLQDHTKQLKDVAVFLEKYKKDLLSFEKPKWNCKCLSEIFEKDNFENILDIKLFIANGLEHIINVEEKKWTRKMKLKATTGLILGISELSCGVFLFFLNSVILKYFNTAFLKAGAKDILFSIKSISSGYWEGYRNRKNVDVAIIINETAVLGIFLPLILAALRSKTGASKNDEILENIKSKIFEENETQIYDMQISYFEYLDIEILDEITDACFNHDIKDYVSVRAISTFRQYIENTLNMSPEITETEEGILNDICENIKIIEKAILLKGNIKKCNQKIMKDLKEKLKTCVEDERNASINKTKELKTSTETFFEKWCDLLKRKTEKILYDNSKLGKFKTTKNIQTNYLTLIKKHYKIQKKFTNDYVQRIQTPKAPQKSSNEHLMLKAYRIHVTHLMKKLKSRTLLSRIIQENITMDFESINVCNTIIKDIFKIPGIRIIIKDENNEILEQLSSISGHEFGSTVRVKFTEYGYINHGNLEPIKIDAYVGNEFLFTALSEVLPYTTSGQITSEDLRNNITDYIKEHTDEVDKLILNNFKTFSLHFDINKLLLYAMQDNQQFSNLEKMLNINFEKIYLQRKIAFNRALSKLNNKLYKKLENDIFCVSYDSFQVKEYDCVSKKLPKVICGRAHIKSINSDPIDINFDFDFGTAIESSRSCCNLIEVQFRIEYDEKYKTILSQNFSESINDKIVISTKLEEYEHLKLSDITEIGALDLFDGDDTINEMNRIIELHDLDRDSLYKEIRPFYLKSVIGNLRF